MKIFLNYNLSIVEYLYYKTLGDSPELLLDFHKSDTIIGCTSDDLFYDKTIIINNDKYDKDNLIRLSAFNKVISRFQLPSGSIDYELMPYDEVNLVDFEFNGTTNETMSKFSIDKFLVHKNEGIYQMKRPKMFLSSKIKGDNTIIGLLKNQYKEVGQRTD